MIGKSLQRETLKTPPIIGFQDLHTRNPSRFSETLEGFSIQKPLKPKNLVNPVFIDSLVIGKMKTRLQKALTDDIGFVTKEQLKQYEILQSQSDIISECSRTLDVSIGGLSVTYMTFLNLSGSNDLVCEAFKFGLSKCQCCIREMIRKLQQAEQELKQAESDKE